MKDRVLYFIYKIGKVPLFRKIFISYYKLAIFLIRKKFKKTDWIESFYLKGSFLSDEFIPIVSDLDFFFVGYKNEQHEVYISNYFKKLNYVFPFVSDFEFHDNKDIEFILKYGGLKYLPNSKKWKSLKGDSFNFKYKFLPIKYYIDTVQEVYFQFEYLFENLKKRKAESKYRTLVIQRQFVKVQNLINQVAFLDRGYFVNQIMFKEDLKWRLLSNEEILFKFNNYVENSYLFSFLHYFLDHLRVSKLFDDFFANEFKKEEIEILSSLQKVDWTKRIFLSEKNLKIFYLSGAIDSNILEKIYHYNSDSFLVDVFRLKYFARIIEGYSNFKHDMKWYEEHRYKFLLLAKKDDKLIQLYGAPFSTLRRNICYVCGKPSEDGLKKIKSFKDFFLINILPHEDRPFSQFDRTFVYKNSNDLYDLIRFALLVGAGQNKIIYLDAKLLDSEVIDKAINFDWSGPRESYQTTFYDTACGARIILGYFEHFTQLLKGQGEQLKVMHSKDSPISMFNEVLKNNSKAINGHSLKYEAVIDPYLGKKDLFYEIKETQKSMGTNLDDFISYCDDNWCIPGCHFILEKGPMHISIVSKIVDNPISLFYRLAGNADFIFFEVEVSAFTGGENEKFGLSIVNSSSELVNYKTQITNFKTLRGFLPVNKKNTFFNFEFLFKNEKQISLKINNISSFHEEQFIERKTISILSEFKKLKIVEKGFYKAYIKSKKNQLIKANINLENDIGKVFSNNGEELVFYFYSPAQYCESQFQVNLEPCDILVFDIILLDISI